MQHADEALNHPTDPVEFVLELTPGEHMFRTIGPPHESPPHETPNPLKDRAIVTDLAALREAGQRRRCCCASPSPSMRRRWE